MPAPIIPHVCYPNIRIVDVNDDRGGEGGGDDTCRCYICKNQIRDGSARGELVSTIVPMDCFNGKLDFERKTGHLTENLGDLQCLQYLGFKSPISDID